MELRPYQVDTLTNLSGHLAFDEFAVIPLPGGGGKSVLISELAREAYKNKQHCVVLTNMSALIPQLARHLDEFKIKYNLVKAGSHKLEPDAYVSLIMEQSFHKKKRQELDIPCELLIKDEQHIGIGQKRYEEIVLDLEPDKTVGTTFTPIDEKGYLMGGITKDNIVETVSVKELVEQGYLAPLKYFVPKWAEQKDYAEVANSGNDYNGKELDRIINTDEHTKLVIKSMNEMNAKKKKTLVYASSIEHADRLKNALEADGYTVGIVHSKNDSESNSEAIARYRGEEVRVEPTLENPDGKLLPELDCLVSVLGLTVGFDAPATTLLVNLRPTKVLRLYLQILARASRIFDGKTHGEILDLSQGTRTHGFLDEPIEYIEKGEAEKLKESKDKRAANALPLMVEDTPTEVNRKMILIKIKELQAKAERVPELKLNDLIALYETSTNTRKIIEIAYEMNRRKNGTSYTHKSIEWVASSWDEIFKDYPEYNSRLIKTLRTRAKNIVVKNKKLASLFYFPEWLREQVPFIYKKDGEPTYHEDFDIDEDDIPF